MSDSVRPHRRQPTRLPRPWDSPGKNTGVGCRFLLQCMKVKREREVAQSYPTLRDPMDCSPPGPSFHGILQARVLEWGAMAFSLMANNVKHLLCAWLPSVYPLCWNLAAFFTQVSFHFPQYSFFKKIKFCFWDNYRFITLWQCLNNPEINNMNNLKSGQKIWKDIDPEKIYKWPISTWKDRQPHEVPGEYRSKPQWDSISHPLEWL